jgi:hypothetical protein
LVGGLPAKYPTERSTAQRLEVIAERIDADDGGLATTIATADLAIPKLVDRLFALLPEGRISPRRHLDRRVVDEAIGLVERTRRVSTAFPAAFQETQAAEFRECEFAWSGILGVGAGSGKDESGDGERARNLVGTHELHLPGKAVAQK